jgi:signal transduction histidine kinase
MPSITNDRDSTEGRRGVLSDGPGWAVAAILFVIGIVLGAIITGSPIQERVPLGSASPARSTGPPARSPLGRFAPVIAPGLIPFYTAALSLPLFLWLTRRAPVTRTNWWRVVPIWAAAVVVVTLVGETALLVLRFGPGASPRPIFFLVRRFVSTAPLVLGSVALAYAVDHRRRAHAAALEAVHARAELAVAQLSALTAQLRPHFLFNTLQTVSTLLHRDVESADAVLGRLGELLHASLQSDAQTVIPLADEMHITEAYLAIARERFGDRLRATVEVGPGTDDAMVPAFLLQPLVENAVHHGIEPSVSGGCVDVRVENVAGMLVLSVRDSGSGYPPGEREGIGLGNTRRRLEAIYGSRADLSVESDATSGTRVTVRLPPTLPVPEGG